MQRADVEKRIEYLYKSRAVDGRTIYGRLKATDVAAAVRQIRDLHLTPVDIVEAQANHLLKSSSHRGFSHYRITEKDKVIFFRQLAVMVSAGITLSESLDTLSGQMKNRALIRVVRDLAARVKAGEPLSEAFAAQGKIFPAFFYFLIKTGEESGRLDDTLMQLSDALERKAALRQKIVTALLYPATVMAIAFIVMALLVTVIVPQFEAVFRNLGTEMPVLTQYAFRIGRSARELAGSGAILFCVLFILLWIARRYRACKKILDRIVLALPIFGDICRKASYARSFSVMALMLSSGVALADSLELAGMTASNEVIKRDFLSMREGVIAGQTMQMTMSKERSFNPMVQQMVAVGEATGKMEHIFAKLAAWYERELGEKVRRLTTLMEPVVIVLVGLVVAFMAFSIFLPIVSSIQTLI